MHLGKRQHGAFEAFPQFENMLSEISDGITQTGKMQSEVSDGFAQFGKVLSEAFAASALASREKDYDDYFRSITFRNKAEQEAVVGSIEHNDFLQELKPQTEAFNANLQRLFAGLR